MRFFSQHGEKIPCQHGAPFPDVVEVRPLPAASFARAPGVSCGACSVPPPGVPIVATWACAPPSSVPALSAVFTILDGNRWCVDVSFPGGPPPLPAPTWASADHRRGRAFPPGHTSSTPSGFAPGPSSRFRLPLWNFGVFHHFCHNGHLSSVRQDPHFDMGTSQITASEIHNPAR